VLLAGAKDFLISQSEGQTSRVYSGRPISKSQNNDCSTKCFQTRRISPVRILEDHQHRILAGKRLDGWGFYFCGL